jgi:hypothetical protein
MNVKLSGSVVVRPVDNRRMKGKKKKVHVNNEPQFTGQQETTRSSSSNDLTDPRKEEGFNRLRLQLPISQLQYRGLYSPDQPTCF